jgi:hypothetical protein
VVEGALVVRWLMVHGKGREGVVVYSLRTSAARKMTDNPSS